MCHLKKFTVSYPIQPANLPNSLLHFTCLQTAHTRFRKCKQQDCENRNRRSRDSENDACIKRVDAPTTAAAVRMESGGLQVVTKRQRRPVSARLLTHLLYR